MFAKVFFFINLKVAVLKQLKLTDNKTNMWSELVRLNR